MSLGRELYFNTGDTNFIALVNHHTYYSFIEENWDFEMLKRHWICETQNENILVFQMTEEGIESDWKISITTQPPKDVQCYRKDEGVIKVTNGELCFVEYTCLTMAAQFKDCKIPDEYCKEFKFSIENGVYKVGIFQFYNVDEEKYIGCNDTDIMFVFTKEEEVNKNASPKIFWCTY